jgi:hypothetical protein
MHVVCIDGHEGFSVTEIDDLAGGLWTLPLLGEGFTRRLVSDHR